MRAALASTLATADAGDTIDATGRYLCTGQGAGKGTMTERVRAFRDHLPAGCIPLPHPSWRTGAWEKRNSWFNEELLPELQRQVAVVLAG